jgi:hypothetical protein
MQLLAMRVAHWNRELVRNLERHSARLRKSQMMRLITSLLDLGIDALGVVRSQGGNQLTDLLDVLHPLGGSRIGWVLRPGIVTMSNFVFADLKFFRQFVGATRDGREGGVRPTEDDDFDDPPLCVGGDSSGQCKTSLYI